MPLSTKLNYLLTGVRHFGSTDRKRCPSCGGTSSRIVATKNVVTALRRCEGCLLQFRTPTMTDAESFRFYQNEYSQGFTTDCPSDDELAAYVSQGFVGCDKDYSRLIRAMEAAGAEPGQRLFELGCSWGYGSWQLSRYGFDVEAFELSAPRRAYAREKLGIRTIDSTKDAQPPYDIFFSSHVLEHIPSVAETIAFGWSVLRPGGLLVAFTPNGSMDYRETNQRSWNRLWGLVHPVFLDEQFYSALFGNNRYLITTNPYDNDSISGWRNGAMRNRVTHPLTGNELLIIAVKEYDIKIR